MALTAWVCIAGGTRGAGPRGGGGHVCCPEPAQPGGWLCHSGRRCAAVWGPHSLPYTQASGDALHWAKLALQLAFSPCTTQFSLLCWNSSGHGANKGSCLFAFALVRAVCACLRTTLVGDVCNVLLVHVWVNENAAGPGEV